MAQIENKGSLTQVLKDVIAETERGNILQTTGLKKLCETCINTFKKYKEQNKHGIAFEIMAKQLLTPETFERIEQETKRLIELEEEDAKKNGLG